MKVPIEIAVAYSLMRKRAEENAKFDLVAWIRNKIKTKGTMNKEQAAQRMGQRITAMRKLEGISQQELADRAGLTRQHIGRIEKGELVSVAYVTIQQVAEALDMTVDIIDPRLEGLAPLKKLQ